MKKTLHTELWKAFHNGYFYLALLIGAYVAVVDAIENYPVVSSLMENTIKFTELGYTSGSFQGFSLMLMSLPYNGVNYATRLFVFIWPVLAAMPFGWSYTQERNNGVTAQILTRTGKKAYYASKFIAVFVSGGVAVMFPAVADIMLNALFCPYEQIDVTFSISSIFNGYFLSELYYRCAWLHCIIWFLVLFLLGGSAASLCFLAGSKFHVSFLAIMVPFGLLMVWDIFYNNILRTFLTKNTARLLWSPIQLVMAASSAPNPAWLVFTQIGILLAIGMIALFCLVKKHDVL